LARYAADHIVKDLFLGAKVLVDGLFADLEFPGNVAHRGLFVPKVVEMFLESIRNLLFFCVHTPLSDLETKNVSGLL
jgi:hypothetical protein